ncbi:hypothetical protein KV701_20490, partial [Limnobaculum sp. M2-1]|uniref:hypothetical protein n=1 Tax=Limnobaculum sp. M2-1 TaxID=2855838 RepID=UPI001C44746B
MDRDTIIFELNHSYYLEKMHATLFGRIDRFLYLIIIFLGASVFASFKGTFVFGGLIALVSALSFVYQFGKASAYADDRSKKYLLLIRKAPDLDDKPLKEELIKLEDFDSKVWHSLEFA